MGWTRTALVGLIGLAMLAACGGDDSSSSDTPGAGATSSTQSDAGALPSCIDESTLVVDGTGDTSLDYLCDANPSTNAEAANACRNDADCAIIDSGLVRDMARSCGLSSRSVADCDARAEFNKTCVIQETSTKIAAPGLSTECASCYAEIVLCSLHFCLSECAANADAPECVTCQLASGCRIPFEQCSGLERK